MLNPFLIDYLCHAANYFLNHSAEHTGKGQGAA